MNGTEMAADDETRLREYVDNAARGGVLRLPPEPKLGEALGVTRGRLRTLLTRLEAEGLIWRHVGKGTFVGPRQISVEDQSWSALISVGDIFDARLVLEPQLAAQAAIHATPTDLAALEQCFTEMVAASTFLQWKRLDERLHRIIAEATHNTLLLMLYDALRAHAKASLDARTEQIYGRASGHLGATDKEHRAFIEAIRLHDPIAAEQAMRTHLRSVRAQLFGSL